MGHERLESPSLNPVGGSDRFAERTLGRAFDRDGEGKPPLGAESSDAEEVSPSSSLESCGAPILPSTKKLGD